MLEKMDEFFAARAGSYDAHMIENVIGCEAGYKKMAALLPQNIKTLLDLGCGTGLELDEIFKLHPDIEVTGVDLTRAMLDKLSQKHPDKGLTLICGDYFKVDFGIKTFDAAVSFQTMHHFEKDAKVRLYSKLCSWLAPSGLYIECDYMALNQADEDYYFSENRRIREDLRISPEEFYHYDTPCTVENQITMLLTAGFSRAEMVFREGNTTMIIAYK